ncbi:hypothetical protein V8C35DRAFT_303204 [Trichoderma chlorosporum]
MSRRCFLVSRPIELVSPEAKVTKWRAIGNGEAVPRLNEKLPFIQHWGLCVLPSGSDELSSDPLAREAFLNADYFDLEVPPNSFLQNVGQSNSYKSFGHFTTKWKPTAVMDISAVLYLGKTARSNHWISERARYLITNWGTYRPVLWNCQHFSVFMAQITVSTNELPLVINRIMAARAKFVFGIRGSGHMGCGAGVVASSFVPVVGPALALGFWAAAGIRMVADWMKRRDIFSIWTQFREKFKELRQIRM